MEYILEIIMGIATIIGSIFGMILATPELKSKIRKKIESTSLEQKRALGFAFVILTITTILFAPFLGLLVIGMGIIAVMSATFTFIVINEIE